MNQQLEFDFRSPEEIAKEKQIAENNAKAYDALFSEDKYIYNKYVDFLLDVIPFRLGWKIKNWPTNIRWWVKCKYQKIRYGVSDDDVFSLYYNIAQFALPRLKYFKEKGKIGIPANLLPNNYHTLKGEEWEAAEKKALKEWDYILGEMIFAFEYTIDGDKFCEMPDILSWEGRDFFSNREKTLEEKQAWDGYLEKSNRLNERKANGLILFAKYYDCLWI